MSNLTYLAALLGHLNANPHLDDTFTGAPDTRSKLRLQVYPFHAPLSDDHLVPLAAWARTLTDCQPIHVHLADNGRLHLTLRGQLADGTPAEIACLPGEQETDLLAANLPLVEGTEFDVATLYRLTSPADAEQVIA